MASETVPMVSVQTRERWYGCASGFCTRLFGLAAVIVIQSCTQLLSWIWCRWSGIPSMGWTVVGLAFVAGASGAAFNHYYTGELDKETRQKYTAATTFV